MSSSSSWLVEEIGCRWCYSLHCILVESGKRLPYKMRYFLPDEAKAFLYEFDMLALTDGVLYQKQQKEDQEVYQLVLPKEYHKAALQWLHNNAGHLGIEKTLNFVQEWFFWPKMSKDVEDYVKSCERHIKRKSPSQVAPMTPIHTTHPLQFVTMDYLTVEKPWVMKTS